jgi:hypothetical protein
MQENTFLIPAYSSFILKNNLESHLQRIADKWPVISHAAMNSCIGILPCFK